MDRVSAPTPLIEAFLDFNNFQQAWEKVASKRGSAGVDGETIEAFSHNLIANLYQLRDAVAQCSYTPLPYQQVCIPKGKRKKRAIAVPTVRDRIVQNALLNVLSPWLDPQFSPSSFAYRPKRSYLDAVKQVAYWRQQGYCWVLDADIANYFDSIDHQRLLHVVRNTIDYLGILYLIKGWLCAGIQTAKGVVRTQRGIPQGAVISPLLANLYLHEFDQWFDSSEYRLVRYADDFVVLTTGESEVKQAYMVVSRLLASLKLALHPRKTQITSFEGGFRFLGHGFLADAIFPLESQPITSTSGNKFPSQKVSRIHGTA